MSSQLRTSRNNSKFISPLSPSVKILCPVHNQPIIKIETQTRSLICSQCEQINTPINLEEERIKATGLFKQFIKQFKNIHQSLQKSILMFKQPGIPQIKRSIKLMLPQVQNLIDKKLQQQIQKGNQRLKRQIEKELQPWSFLEQDQIIINSLQQINRMLNYKQMFEQIKNKIEISKNNIKQQIIKQVKKVVRQYYQKNLIL